MNTYEIIKDLAKQKKISIRQLEMDFGYSNGYLGSWKRQTPNSTELARLADYFNVSVDYLLGRTNNPVPLTEVKNDKDFDYRKEEDIRIIQRAARNMDDEDRKKAMELWKIAFNKAFEEDKNN